MRELLDQLQTFYAGLEPQRRKVLWAALVVSLLTVIGVGFWAATPTYVMFTRAESADQAVSITRALAAANVPYKTDADGLSIRVPVDSELEARRVAASDNGIVGLEGLLQIDPWTTPFQETLHRQQMLQGELVRMINGVGGVANSVVLLNVPEPSAFLRNTQRPSASVTVRPEAGVRLDSNMARGIAVLVSHAVAGMKPEEVSVLDASTGRLIWDQGEGESADRASLDASARSREATLAAGVRKALTDIFGRTNAATVTVAVETEGTETAQTSTVVDPGSAVAIKERIETESSATGASTAGGVPGTDSNVPERPSTTGGGSSSGRNKDSSETTYDLTRTTTTTKTNAGGIKRISAAVAIDSAALATLVGSGDPAVVQASIEKAISAALGADPVRGDTVVVTFVPFAPTPELPELTEPPIAVTTVVQSGVALAVALAAFVFVVRPLLQAVKPATAAASPAAAAAAAANAAVAAKAAEPEEEPELEPPLDLTARLRAQLNRVQPHDPRDLSELVRHEPALAAEVVRRWIQHP